MDEADDLHARGVGAGRGPAGLAAAGAASGLDVLLLDAAPQPGGQIWRARQGVVVQSVERALAGSGNARVLAGTRVVMALPGRALLVDGPDGARRVHWNKLVLATGARERQL